MSASVFCIAGENATTGAGAWRMSAADVGFSAAMCRRLSAELWAASQGEGGAIKRKDEMHRMAEANKAYSHYRW